MTYASLLRPVSQREPLDDRQVRNNAGGFVYAIDDISRLERFLILGSDSPTYYESARELTRDNAAVVVRCWQSDAERTASVIADVSQAGRAAKVSPALFALALGEVSDQPLVCAAARRTVPLVVRTASHLFEYVALVTELGRGWGRGFRRSVADWYRSRDVAELAFQMAKYRSRNGLDHGRLLRLAHPEAGSDERRALWDWAFGREVEEDRLPERVRGFVAASKATSEKEMARLVETYRLPLEMVPTDFRKSALVWKALLPNLGMTALLRSLSTLSRLGLLEGKGSGGGLRAVEDALTDTKAIRRSRVHPFSVLTAMAAYRKGRAGYGDHSWKVTPRIIDALDEAFGRAFKNIEPTGKRHLLALDVSGSMGNSLMGSGLSAREGSAAMALVTGRVEREVSFVGFSQGMTPLQISGRQRLDDAVKAVSNLPFQRTDCALPMLHALERGIEVDMFVIFTDNETWAGGVHPKEALRRYRKETGIAAKLAVVGMTSTGFSIADPADAGMMDFVGFDASAPRLLADFARQ